MTRVLIFGMFTGMGGVETYIMNLYRNIDREKIQFDFVIPGTNSYFEKEIKTLGGNIFYITPKRISVISNVIDLIKVLKMCRNTHKVVYFNFSVLYYNLPYIFSKLFRFHTVIAHAHSSGPKKKKKNIRYFLHCLNRIYVSMTADSLLACSQTAGYWIFGEKVMKKKDKVKIIPNAIPSKLYEFNDNIRQIKRNEFGITPDKLVVGHVGRFSPEKNHLFLLDIFKEIVKKNNNSILLLVGDGELRPQVEKKISSIGLDDKVILTGNRSDVPEVLQAMDIFVLPSKHEGLPFVLIEAQAAGLKCFASKDIVTTESNITGLVNFISIDENPNIWAERILECSLNYNRQSIVKEIKNAGYEIKDVAKEIEELINC